jgi:signal transduction histidine kinase/DNA-binding NarL/FixJ family response regulator
MTAVVGPGLPPFITFYPAVMLTALLTGVGPGLVATLTSAALISLFALPPLGRLATASPVDRLSLVVFVAGSLLLSWIAEVHRRYRTASIEAARSRDKAEGMALALKAFVANVSHEIRTPITDVLALTYLIKQTPLNDAQDAYMAKIKRSMLDLLEMVNNVLDVSKIEAGAFSLNPAPFDLRAFVDSAAAAASSRAQAKGLAFKVVLPETLPAALDADCVRLAQILNNLLNNAVNFTDRGSITLSVACEPAVAGAVTLVLTVEDTGIGIDDATKARLFTPFVQAAQSASSVRRGTGLGLSIVRQMTELMSGAVEFDSTVGRGSRFTVRLPMMPAAAPPPASADSPSDIGDGPVLAGLRVLVADDSEIVREVIAVSLSASGAAVTTAADGLSAIERLGGDPCPFDLVLMDLQMPGLGGIAAARRIRADPRLASLRIMALTANASVEHHEEAIQAGMTGFIAKPFSKNSLVGAILDQMKTSAWRAPGSAPDEPGLLGAATPLYRELLNHMIADLGRRDLSPDLIDPATTTDRRAWLHKLAGAAASLGQMRMSQLAAKGEIACAAGDQDALARIMRELAAELEALRAEAAPLPVEPDPTAAWNDATDTPLAAALVESLRRGNPLAGLEFERLRPRLAVKLGPDRIAEADRQIAGLDFESAAENIDEALAPPSA